MSDNDFLERRRYRRVNVSIPVKYREVNSDEIIESTKILHDTECVNISRGGMQILTQDEWKKEEDKLIEAMFVMSGRNIRLIAHAAWSCYDASIKKFRTGVEFIAIKSGDLEVIGQIA